MNDYGLLMKSDICFATGIIWSFPTKATKFYWFGFCRAWLRMRWAIFFSREAKDGICSPLTREIERSGYGFNKFLERYGAHLTHPCLKFSETHDAVSKRAPNLSSCLSYSLPAGSRLSTKVDAISSDVKSAKRIFVSSSTLFVLRSLFK